MVSTWIQFNRVSIWIEKFSFVAGAIGFVLWKKIKKRKREWILRQS